MNEFSLWFTTGVQHILDLQGYDHILFVTLLTLTFPFKEWKKLLVLVTAFTVGHSVSLALSATNIIYVQQNIIELLIALTILVSAVYNLICHFEERKISKDASYRQHDRVLYIITLFFGLIHGLGFSYLLKAMLGKEESVFLPLMYFNLGLELGQIIIVIFVLIFSLLLARFFKWKHTIFKLSILCLIALIALKISAERLLELFQ
ncbi:MAG: HupE/UreJ family protein [Bacteroidetes bacterium]|nr:HupE/UreJ family protein [Bacteroidota bacterium]